MPIRSTNHEIRPKIGIGYGGGRGIRTLGTLTRTTVFETAPFDHSGIPPVTRARPDRAT